MQRANKYAKSKTMDFNKISELQHECYRVIKWFQVHKKIKLIQWLDLCIYKTKLIYTAKRKRKEKSLNISIPQCFNGRCSYIFAYYSLFYPEFRKKHTNIVYIERVALHEKTVLIRLLIFTIRKLFKISYAETVLEIK